MRFRTLTLLILLFVFGRLIISQTYKAPTMDEPHHIARGLVYLKLGRNVWNGNPPLAHLLMAAPLFLDSSMIPDSAKLQSPDFRILGQAFLQTVQPRWRAAFFVARLPNMLMLLVLLSIVAAWASQWFGRRAGALSLLLCAFDPNLLANAQLATPDIAVTLFCTGAGYQAWRFNRTHRWRDALLLGLWAGLALSTKFTAIIVLGLIGLALVISYLQEAGRRKKALLREAFTRSVLPSSFILSAFIVWAVYRFNVGTTPGVPIPLPAPDYLGELLWQATINGLHRSSFLADHLYPTGVTSYFLLAFLLKTPTAIVILLITALLRLPLRQAQRPLRMRATLPAIVFFGYFALVLLSPLNIGYRHLLPILPFAYILIGSLLPSAMRHLPSAIMLVLLGWTTASSLASFPYDLAYFAEWSGGPQNGFHWLVDSNLDWGQDLYALATKLRAERGPVFPSYFGPTDTRVLGWSASGPELVEGLPNWDRDAGTTFHPANPAPGLYAISATNLQGVILNDSDAFDFFRRRRPEGSAGYSILLYRVPEPSPAPTWVAACENKRFQINSQEIEQLLGSGYRILHFDCDQSWVVPSGLGWYVLPDEMPNVAQLWGGKNELVYRQSNKLSVYRYERQGFTPPASASIASSSNIKFVGASFTDSSSSVITFWQVLGPADPQLSIYGHRLAAEGYMLEGSDGLGFSTTEWKPGDIFLQWHTFSTPLKPDEFFETGVYNWETGQRWLTVPVLSENFNHE